MEPAKLIDILNELLACESRSLVTRFLESGAFVSRLSVRDFDVLQAIARRTEDNARWLAEAITRLAGTPGRGVADVSTGDLHFLELPCVLPRLTSDRNAMIQKYTLASQRLADEPLALPLVQRILQRHGEDMESLSKLGASTHGVPG